MRRYCKGTSNYLITFSKESSFTFNVNTPYKLHKNKYELDLLGYWIINVYYAQIISIISFFLVIYNALMLSEIALLGFIARKLYKRELPDVTYNAPPIVTTHITTISSIIQNESNNNTANVNKNDIRNETETAEDPTVISERL